ncbi:MAG: hypothetical protein LBT75_05080 [Bacilli bacterium]|jgi:hypothetical protein|nr:hypothetical protein [Bacilli bacterium]
MKNIFKNFFTRKKVKIGDKEFFKNYLHDEDDLPYHKMNIKQLILSSLLMGVMLIIFVIVAYLIVRL